MCTRHFFATSFLPFSSTVDFITLASASNTTSHHKVHIMSNRIISTSSTTGSSMLPFLAGAAVGIASSMLYVRYYKRPINNNTRSSSKWKPPSTLPKFAQDILSKTHHENNNGNSETASNMTTQSDDNDSTDNAHNHHHHWTEVRLREWEDLEWRDSNGWQGRDLCHNPEGLGVCVLHYYFDSIQRQMIGVVWFGPEAESHRGLCHGGAMTSLMDDFCGHLAFLNSKSPWSGATVQVNVSLKKPVPVGSTLRIIGNIHETKGRKIFVHATLDNGEETDPVIYATMEGLSIDGVKMSQHEDPVSKRTWEVEVCERSGRLQRRDSGWKLR